MNRPKIYLIGSRRDLLTVRTQILHLQARQDELDADSLAELSRLQALIER